MYQFFISGMRSGLRGKSFHAVIVFGLTLLAVAYLSSSFSPRQPMTVALDVGLSGVRITLVLMVLFWVQELVVREIDRKSILFSLAYPVSRPDYLLGRYFSIIALAGLAMLLLGLCLSMAVILGGSHYQQEYPVVLGAPYWISLLAVLLDVAVVAAFALFIAMVTTSPIMPLAVGAGFAVASRALGATMSYLGAGADGDLAMVERFGRLTEVMLYVLPDLSRLDWRDWPMYGLAPDTPGAVWAVVMASAYIVFLLSLAAFTFCRREFS